MMGIDVQWHLVGDRDKARTLIEEVTSWAQQIRDAVLVFQDMWWQPDYDLWRSVQKVSCEMMWLLIKGIVGRRYPRGGVQEAAAARVPQLFQVGKGVQGPRGAVEAWSHLPWCEWSV